MYPLNTTLIFTELAEAAAAARLFGVCALQTQEGKGWSDKFSSVVEKGWETWQAETWRIVIDTEEKCGWFKKTAGCYIEVMDIFNLPQAIAWDDIVNAGQEKEHEHYSIILYPKIIDNKWKMLPFPQPQEVIETKETL